MGEGTVYLFDLAKHFCQAATERFGGEVDERNATVVIQPCRTDNRHGADLVLPNGEASPDDGERTHLFDSVLFANRDQFGFGRSGLIENITFGEFSQQTGQGVHIPLELRVRKQVLFPFQNQLATGKLPRDGLEMHPN